MGQRMFMWIDFRGDDECPVREGASYKLTTYGRADLDHTGESRKPSSLLLNQRCD